MGLFSGIKKIFKGVGKVVKKVVKGIAKLGKKVVKGVGKFMGKLGPIGTIAVGILAPYALGAIAGAGMGWMSTAASKALEIGSMVKSAVGAPFKALGQAVGKGVSALGQATGSESFMTLTDKIASGLGYTGGDISTNASKIFGDVANQYNSIAGNAPAIGGGEAGSVFDLSGGVEFSGQGSAATAGEGFFGPADPFNPAQEAISTEGLLSSKATVSTPADLTIDNTGMQGLTEAERASFGKSEPSLFDKLKKGLSGLGSPSGFDFDEPPSISGDGYEAITSAGGEGGQGSGSFGRSFHAQEQTGLDPTEEFAQQMNYGLFGQRRGMA